MDLNSFLLLLFSIMTKTFSQEHYSTGLEIFSQDVSGSGDQNLCRLSKVYFCVRTEEPFVLANFEEVKNYFLNIGVSVKEIIENSNISRLHRKCNETVEEEQKGISGKSFVFLHKNGLSTNYLTSLVKLDVIPLIFYNETIDPRVYHSKGCCFLFIVTTV